MSSRRHVHQSCDLVHRQWPHRWCNRFLVRLRLRRVLLSHEIPSLCNCGSSVDSDTRWGDDFVVPLGLANGSQS